MGYHLGQMPLDQKDMEGGVVVQYPSITIIVSRHKKSTSSEAVILPFSLPSTRTEYEDWVHVCFVVPLSDFGTRYYYCEWISCGTTTVSSLVDEDHQRRTVEIVVVL
jgi:hypothetical protein